MWSKQMWEDVMMLGVCSRSVWSEKKRNKREKNRMVDRESPDRYEGEDMGVSSDDTAGGRLREKRRGKVEGHVRQLES